MDAVASFAGLRILVLGDVMLDRYVYGAVTRMSPEAPIPVLAIERETAMPGGAGNVALNIAALGGEAILVGLVGDDAAGAELRGLLARQPAGITTDLIVDPARPTTCKTRFVADRQQLLRADAEQAAPAGAAATTALLAAFQRHLAEADAVILSDYAKGVLSAELLKAAIAAARTADVPIVADPKSTDFRRYNGVTVLTPNKGEAVAATGQVIGADIDAAVAGATALRTASEAKAILITRGAAGMTLAERGAPVLHLPASAREVFDVSGAGDTVVATLALALAAKQTLPDAARLANAAAGIAVGKIGTAVVRPAELRAALQAGQAHVIESKIAGFDAAHEQVARWRARGEKIAFTNGCFDLIHPGHVSLLTQARGGADRLVVGLNTDASVKRLKGPERPVQNELARATVMASLAAVDLVVLFDEDTPLELIRLLRPDVLVKGADYRVDQVVGADVVQGYGGRVLLADLTPGQSTTGTIARIGRGAA